MGRCITGMATEPGSFACPPNIEGCIAPVEDQTNGVFVVNASIAGVGVISHPVTVTVKGGVVVSVDGGEEADRLRATLESPGRSAVLPDRGARHRPEPLCCSVRFTAGG